MGECTMYHRFSFFQLLLNSSISMSILKCNCRFLHKLHPVHAASHQSLSPHALMLSLKCSDVSYGPGSIKGPSVKQYFGGWTVTCLCLRLRPPVRLAAVTPGGLSLCDVLQWSILTCWEPCLWMPRCMHIDFFIHNTQQKTDYWFGLNHV